MALEQLSLVRLRFDLETREESRVPAYKGDMLRMALLWWLSTFWCPMPNRCRHGCRQSDICMFGRLVEPPLDPGWPSQIRMLVGNSPPPAYVLWDNHDRRCFLPIGTAWQFELTLAGDLALEQIPAVIAAVQEGADQGMGRIRLRSRVCRVVALTAQPGAGSQEHGLAREQDHGDERLLTWQDYRLDDISLTYKKIKQHAQAWDKPVHALSLRYLSPVKIKLKGQWVETPDFTPVARALVRRLRILSVVHGAGEWPQSEYGPLLDLAETVRLEHNETHLAGYTRHSKRSGTQQIKGFIGQAWYASHADLRPLLPLLWLGQWLHIGKGYVLGSGRYSIEQAYT